MRSDGKKKAGNCWFIVVFFVFCCYAGYGLLFDGEQQLSGVVDSGEAVACSVESMMDGSYQSHLNTYFEENFFGRKLLIRLRSQLLYSLCRVSPNENVVIGKERYLYEPMYIMFELQAYAPSSEEYFAELGENLTRLRALLEENGKELYVFISPSKAHYIRDKIPFRYELLSREGTFSRENHEELKKTLLQNGICFFDSNEYIDANAKRYFSPLFYASGIHWSHVWGESAAAEFLNLINEQSKWDLGEITVKEISSSEPIPPDTDLYDSLNLFSRPEEEWYGTQAELVREGEDKPNVFMRGSSFMGQSLSMLVNQGVFGRNVYFENYYYNTDEDSQYRYVSSNEAYDEVNMDRLMGQSDILVIEVNDAGIYKTGMGLIEYLLANPEYMDDVYEDVILEEGESA
ncbi:MAG TPA: hypothetical protein DCZ91_14445 [Lachnospiraceae bacterium]|nr:hypothetical protein [Lachnospiraceae bacterium]